MADGNRETRCESCDSFFFQVKGFDSDVLDFLSSDNITVNSIFFSFHLNIYYFFYCKKILRDHTAIETCEE